MHRRYFTCFAFTLSVALAVGTAGQPEAASPENRSPVDLPVMYRTDRQPADDASPPAPPPETKGDLRLCEAVARARPCPPLHPSRRRPPGPEVR